MFRSFVPLGKAVVEGQVVGMIGDPFDKMESEVVADRAGIVIGQTAASLVDEGDALFHVAQPKASPERVEERIIQSAEKALPEMEHPPYRDSHATE